MTEHSPDTSALVSCFRHIPLRIRQSVFVALFQAGYHLDARHRLAALQNLKRAFPEKPVPELIAIARGVFRNMGLVAAEFFDIPWLTAERIRERVEVEGAEHYAAAAGKGRGLLLFGAHFGNWEFQAVAVSLLFHPLTFVYRPLDNPFLERLVTSVRTSTGNIAVPTKKSMRQMLRTLKDNGTVGLLIDQNWSRREGVFVEFFGRPAGTTDGLALLALHTGAPVIPAFMVRKPNGNYRLVIGQEVPLVDTGDRKTDAIVNTQNFTRVIEALVRQYPDQWLWVHRRWQSQPRPGSGSRERMVPALTRI